MEKDGVTGKSKSTENFFPVSEPGIRFSLVYMWSLFTSLLRLTRKIFTNLKDNMEIKIPLTISKEFTRK